VLQLIGFFKQFFNKFIHNAYVTSRRQTDGHNVVYNIDRECGRLKVVFTLEYRPRTFTNLNRVGFLVTSAGCLMATTIAKTLKNYFMSNVHHFHDIRCIPSGQLQHV